MNGLIVVKAVFDPEAGVWLTESADVHGLRIEAPTLEALLDRLPGAIQDLLESPDGADVTIQDLSIEVIAHASTRVRVAVAA